jgi:hypothetical protein
MNPIEIEEIARRAVKEALESEIPRVSEAAAKRAIEIMAAEVGTSVVKKLVVLLGLGILGLIGFLASKGIITSG